MDTDVSCDQRLATFFDDTAAVLGEQGKQCAVFLLLGRAADAAQTGAPVQVWSKSDAKATYGWSPRTHDVGRRAATPNMSSTAWFSEIIRDYLPSAIPVLSEADWDDQ